MERTDGTLDKVKILGRKIFFVNPSSKIENHVIRDLRDNEYEAYCISDFRHVKYVLTTFRDSVCLIYVDSGLSYTTWYKFIKSLEANEIFQGTLIGVLSERIPQAKKDFFLLNADLPCGFTMTNMPFKDIFKRIQMVLDINDAKGKRKFIRLQLSMNKRINAFAEINGRVFSLELLDISSVGFAVNVSASAASAFAPKQLLRSVSVTLEKKTFVIQCVVLMSKVSGKVCNSVLFFLNPPAKFTQAVKTFIFEELDNNMEEILGCASLDKTDYASLDLESFGTYGEMSEDSDDVIEEISEAEEIEEIEEAAEADDGEIIVEADEEGEGING